MATATHHVRQVFAKRFIYLRGCLLRKPMAHSHSLQQMYPMARPNKQGTGSWITWPCLITDIAAYCAILLVNLPQDGPGSVCYGKWSPYTDYTWLPCVRGEIARGLWVLWRSIVSCVSDPSLASTRESYLSSIYPVLASSCECYERPDTSLLCSSSRHSALSLHGNATEPP